MYSCMRNPSKFVQVTQRLAIHCRSSSNVVKDVEPPKDPITHTGQHWDKDDYRLARFLDTPKQINPNFAIKLIAEVPPKAVSTRTTWCDGGSGALGHPRVFINLDAPGNHTCGYCGLRFYQDHSSKGH
ncbi:NADH dehydrogenase [ubiquinone] iron-sulfur protein 6, mitochondrial [Dermacentor andersoni]|uniref:NADH dehydrogenase [ubiquinone] iron-sulfur protein 6, mitochondrial n=1 Tax=Dermacentor andersoni TaxID=34620 RepID=UPI0021556904|nr:NADH dehydrogenase [ubiquinone] iron-sulfur protein 6, mitochondrial-like [Dermacentor andersoni]